MKYKSKNDIKHHHDLDLSYHLSSYQSDCDICDQVFEYMQDNISIK